MPKRVKQRSCPKNPKRHCPKRQCPKRQLQSSLHPLVRVPPMALAPFLRKRELEVVRWVCKSLHPIYNEILIKCKWWTEKQYQRLSSTQQEMVRKLTSVVSVLKLPPYLTHLSLSKNMKLVFPSTLTWLILEKHGPIFPGYLPPHLKTLVLQNYNHPLDQGCLPSNLTELRLYGDFNQPWEHFILPDTLTSLRLGCNFNPEILPDHLPPHLTSLELYRWNHPLLSTVLPSCLQTLELFYFNQPLTHLPSSLRSLILGHYNHPLLQLPPLTELLLNESFNSVVDFPTTLETLRLGSSYRLPFDGQRLVLLRHLSCCNHDVLTTFPPNLETMNGLPVDEWRKRFMPHEIKP